MGGILNNRIVVLIGLLIAGFFSQAQITRSTYFHEKLPESSVLNPAFTTPHKFYVGAPMKSMFYMGFESPFSFEGLTAEWPGGDSLYIDREGVINSLNRRNYFSFELYNELGRAGVRAGRHFFQFSISKVFSTKFSFDKDMVGLFFYGNGHEDYIGKRLSFDRTGFNMTSYHQFVLGYAFEVSEKLTMGVNLKYLNGSFNVWTEKAAITLYTDRDPNYALTASSDIILHTSSTISDFDNLIDQIEGYKWFDLTNNSGYGLDFGLVFQPTEDYKLSASVVDLGWINWKDNVKSFVSANPKEEYTFEGFDINDFVNQGSFADSLDFTDTLQVQFELLELNDPYRSHLNPKIYLGGQWLLSKNNELGVLLRTDLAENRIQPSITINYTRHIGKFLSLYGNYSMLANNFANIGLGVIWKVGPWQFYLMNDNVYAVAQPAAASSYNLQVGMSFVFGKHVKSVKGSGINTDSDSE